MHVNPGRQPPNGPHFQVAPGVELRAPTFEALYLLIVEYRARHALPAGDPRQDVDDYICGRWPHFCHADRKEAPPPTAPKLSTRVAEWAAKLMRDMPAGGYELVDTREAARRAEICRNCPFQEAWRQRCTPCNASTDALLSTVRRMKRATPFVDLGCKLCGNDISTSAWLDEQTMKPSDDMRAKLPANCWIKKL